MNALFNNKTDVSLCLASDRHFDCLFPALPTSAMSITRVASELWKGPLNRKGRGRMAIVGPLLPEN